MYCNLGGEEPRFSLLAMLSRQRWLPTSHRVFHVVLLSVDFYVERKCSRTGLRPPPALRKGRAEWTTLLHNIQINT